MSTDQPPPGSPEDPFAKPPTGGPHGGGPYGAPPPDGPGGPGGPDSPRGPYDTPPPGGPGGPYGGGGGPYGGGGGPYDNGPYGGQPYGGEPDPLAGMPPLAESGKRVLARIIDLVIVFIPAALIDWGSGGTDDFGSGRSAIGGVAFAVIGFVYEWVMTQSTGQTVGKKAMKLRAAMLADGSVPSASAAALRSLVLWLPAFCCTCVWFVIIGITVLFDKPYKQGLHDKAAKTVVVQVV